MYNKIKILFISLSVIWLGVSALGELSPRNAEVQAQSGIVVNSVADDSGCAEKCTLRGAILKANANPGKDTITFDMPYLDVVFPTVSFAQQLPDVTDPVVIDGSMQKPGMHVMVIIPQGMDGLRIVAGNSEINHLSFQKSKSTDRTSPGYGLILESKGGNKVTNSGFYWNGSGGLLIRQSNDNRIEKNNFEENGGPAITVLNGVRNTFRNNVMPAESLGWEHNTGLGIDLGNDGVTFNDVGDTDSGANNLQNFPIFQSDDKVKRILKGTLNGQPNSTFTLEFFSNTSCHASGYGEGEKSLSLLTIATDKDGYTNFEYNYPSDAQNITFVNSIGYSHWYKLRTWLYGNFIKRCFPHHQRYNSSHRGADS